MSAIDRVIALSADNLKCMVVPEWSDDEEEFEIYYTSITIADLVKIQKHAKGSELDTLIYTVIFKSQDKDGKLLFSLEDKVKLKRTADSDVLSNIVLKMKGVKLASLEDYEKN